MHRTAGDELDSHGPAIARHRHEIEQGENSDRTALSHACCTHAKGLTRECRNCEELARIDLQNGCDKYGRPQVQGSVWEN